MKKLYALLVLLAPTLGAQCVMCARTAAAQNLERARVLNHGIFVLLIPPVVILSGFLVLAWRRRNV